MFGEMMSCRADKGMVNQVANQTLPGVIYNSDVDSLNSMGDLTTPGALQMCRPDVVSDFSTSYVSPGGSAANEETKQFNNLLMGYNKIDPSWNSATRNNGLEQIFNVSKINSGSNDFQNLVRTGVMTKQPNANPLMLLASIFPKTNVLAQAANGFPNTAMFNTNSNVRSNDPRTLLKNAVIGAILPKQNTAVAQQSVNRNYTPNTTTSVAFDGTKTVTTRTVNSYTGELSTRVTKYSKYGQVISDNYFA